VKKLIRDNGWRESGKAENIGRMMSLANRGQNSAVGRGALCAAKPGQAALSV
jgi:hypothetical protein